MRNFLKNKKGLELAISTVVILIILLIVLVVVIGFFLGATGKIFKPIVDMLTGSTEQASEQCINLGICEGGQEGTGTTSNLIRILAENSGFWQTKNLIN